MLFVELVDAVLAVLEMVLAIVYYGLWLPMNAGTGIRHHCCATGDDVKGRRDVPSGRGSLVCVVCVCTRSRAAPRCAGGGAGLVSCAAYESCAEGSAEPVPRARPQTLSASGGDPRSRLMVKFFRRQDWSPAASRAAD